MELIEEIKELKEYKENNDLTIAELARKIEADDTTVGRWLKGEVTPNFYSLHKVRNFLNDIKNSEEYAGLAAANPATGVIDSCQVRFLSKAQEKITSRTSTLKFPATR